MSGARLLACAVIAAGLAACGGSGDDVPARMVPTMTISLSHSDLVFDAARQRLYAVSSDLKNPAKIVSVDTTSGQVRDLVTPADPPPYSPIFPQQGTVSLSAHARYLYFATQSGAVSRVDLASGAVDLSLPAPPAMNAKVAAVAASRTDDVAAYVQLRPNDLDPDAIGMLRNSQWGTQWTRVPPPVTSNSAPTLAVRDDDAELLSSFAGLNRVRVTAAGPDVVLATAAIASSLWGVDVPQYVSAGILAQCGIYDATTLAPRFPLPDASVCGVLPSRSRVVCASSATEEGHSLYVFDLTTRNFVTSWLAGFETGTVFVQLPPLRITSLGGGRVAVSYGSSSKAGGHYGPTSIAFYSDAAFN